MKRVSTSNVKSAEEKVGGGREKKASDLNPIISSTSANPWLVEALFEGIQAGTTAYLQSPSKPQEADAPKALRGSRAASR